MATHPNVHRKGTGGKTSPVQISELKPGGAPHGATGHRATAMAIWNTQSKEKVFHGARMDSPIGSASVPFKIKTFPGVLGGFPKKRSFATDGRATSGMILLPHDKLFGQQLGYNHGT